MKPTERYFSRAIISSNIKNKKLELIYSPMKAVFG
jgi:hypothetical protein